MLKILKEARKGVEDNILPFEMPSTKPSPILPGKDWLRGLPFGARFVAKGVFNKSGWLDSYGIGSIQENAILLATDSDYYPGIVWKWVDSAEFSSKNILVQVLPDMKPLEEGEEVKNE